MAMFTKQDFCPPVLSKRWIAIKLRPNMMLYCHNHVISILESGIMFREDSYEVENEVPTPKQVGEITGNNGWMTTGEKIVTAMGLASCVMAFPPKHLQRSLLYNLSLYASVPLVVRWVHRSQCAGSMSALLHVMREYIMLGRRTLACLKEYASLYSQLDSFIALIRSTHEVLCRQQSSLSVLLSRASSAILGNAPWLHTDVAWDAVIRDPMEDLLKIHHAFLVVQSTFLKHLALLHVPAILAQRLYKNYNERLYWVHHSVLPYLTQEFKQNLESLQRTYRLLKNSVNQDTDFKKLGAAFNKNWLYSDVHADIAKTCLDVKITSSKCNSLDVLLDSYATNNHDIDVLVLDKDIDDIIEGLTKCLKTMQNAQLRLKRIRNLCENEDVQEKEIEVTEEDAAIVKIEDREPESKDEVFYFVKTDDDDGIQPAEDSTTAPGKKEIETSKIVFDELKRKLGKREDLMRERERQALAKTMPQLDIIPEFPRQILFDEYIERQGFINKINKQKPIKRNLSIKMKRKRNKRNKINKKYRLKIAKYGTESDIDGDIIEANAKLNIKSRLVTVNCDTHHNITKWCKYLPTDNLSSNESDSSGLSDGQRDYVPGPDANPVKLSHRAVIDPRNNAFKFSRKDLEWSPSSSDTDPDKPYGSLLNDARRNRVVRKKNYPNHRPLYGASSNHRQNNDDQDESLKPMEYRFRTGMAMASVLQVSRNEVNMPQEEVFVGDGELSTDSGNDEDS